MCLQAMSIVYDRHHEDIGPFSDTKYIVGMLERCTDRMERDRLVQFIFKLILHRRNVKDIMDANGVRILVDLLTLAHLHTSRAVVPTQSNVIEAGPNMVRESEKEWHYGNSGERKGPVSFQEMRDLWASGALTLKTKCWAQGMDGWRTLQQVPQLKWCLLAKGTPVVNESDLATLVLNTLNAMCKYFPSRDPDDAIIRPLPRVKRLLSDSVCLPHLVQLLLTFDPVLVEKVATLLCEVLKDNPAVSTIYLTGVFYFILMYTGSNVLPIARFLQLTHTKQALKGTDKASSVYVSLSFQTSDIMQRSVLGQLLPEAMVNYLENHGAEKFAQIYLGEFDTPEAIWNHEMRQVFDTNADREAGSAHRRVQSQAAQQHSCIVPILCNPCGALSTTRTRAILQHILPASLVKLLKDVLDAWTKEVEKKPPAMSIDDAYEDLSLRRGMQHEEATVRKAYYRLAQQFHPDKNPEGREKFEKVSRAYEFLCSRNLWTSQGPNPDNIVLILRTQSILFDRYSEELQPYKYAGYPQLIKTIQLETEDDQLFSKSAPLLAAASELAYHTVHCSALNAEELSEGEGTRCSTGRLLKIASSKPNEVGVQVCMHVTRCYSVAAQFRGCRDKMVEMPQLVKDLCHILYFKHLTRLCLVATECVSSLAVDSILQMQLLQAGCLWHLLLFMFSYDFTLEEGGVQRSEDANQQEVANRLAKLAVRACGRLGGYLTGDLESPNNPVAQDALNSLLTPYLARQLSLDKPEEILKILNSNCETPYLLWDNSTRAELSEYLEQQRHNKLFGETDPTYGTDFVYSIHSKELIVGGIFVRIYNEQPAYPIESELLSGMSSVTLSTADNKQLQNIVMCLEALRNVIKNNAGVEMQCIGHFRLLFALLSAESCKDVQRGALEVIATVTRNHECVNDIAASDILVHLVVVLYTLPDHQVTILDTLYALMSTTKIVKEALTKGALIYLLDLFCNSSAPAVREKTAELLARMGADKLVGPKVRLALGRFLPAAFADAMRDSPQICVHMFEGTHENPELIWDNDARERVSSVITNLREEHYTAQRQNPQMIWRPPDDNVLAKCGAPGELVVGGVYLRLFVANPGWVLRRPKEFLSELLDTCLNLMSKDKPDVDLLELATSALVSLLQAQPALADQVPSLGHIPRLCRQMVLCKQHNDVPKAAILVLHQLATSEVCIQAMGHTECINPLKKAMQARKDMIGVACEALNRLFSANQDQLIKQALEADMVPYLLGLLEGRLETLENPATTKAQIVKALKAMSRSLLLGDKVTAILEKSSVWAEYKDQRHDLFISTPATAGYLTQGTTKTLPDAPPPMDREDPMVRTDII
ncbi:unnamed protein product [Timema podura]|uniref:J domain-containing protein n=1 Tax=Timema podura TaxID=61482 RepID=A0ABN7NHY9_TIMPD|nr:unnamed protein product [Timema podura]